MMKSVLRQIQLAIAGLAICAWAFELGDLDLWVQDALFDPNRHQWWLDRHDPVLRWLFYDGPKAVLVVFALVVALSLFFLRGRRWFSAYRGGALLLLLSLIVVPGVIIGLKNITNVACPADLQRYGGELPYIKVFESYPKGQRPQDQQRCFPAGHASGGFALLALFYLPLSHRRRYLALGSALATGTLMGGYKMLIGHHFLSHTLVTALMSWMLIHVLIVAMPASWRPSYLHRRMEDERQSGIVDSTFLVAE